MFIFGGIFDHRKENHDPSFGCVGQPFSHTNHLRLHLHRRCCFRLRCLL